MRNLRILCAFMGIIGITGEAEKPLYGSSLDSFINGFRGSLADVVIYAYDVALDDWAELEDDFELCEIAIEDEQSDCEHCVKDKCKPGILGSVVKFVADIGKVLHGVSINDIDINIDLDLDLRNVGPQVGHDANVGALSRKKRSSDSDLLRSVLWLRGLKKKLKKAKKKAKKAGKKAGDAVVDTLLGDKDCMDKCDSCGAFLKDTTFLINEVCGEDLLDRNATMAADVEKILWVVGAVNDSVDLIVVQTTVGDVYDPETSSLSDMHVTAKFRLGVHTYTSQYPYRYNEPEDTGDLCGTEYWTKYDEYD